MLDISQCTVSGNTAEIGGGIYSYGTLDIRLSTVSRNAAQTGGGIVNENLLNVTNSIVALNTASVPAEADIHVNGFYQPTGSYNFIGTDNPGVDPRLGPLSDNGGPTQTIAILAGSPLIDAGDPAFAAPPDFDQRGAGFDRVIFGGVDIGAYELQATQIPVENRIGDLIAGVADLAAGGVITKGNATVMTKSLEQSLNQLSKDNPIQAAKQLQNVLEKVAKQIKSLDLASPTYVPDLAALTQLKTEAQSIVNELLGT